MTQIQYCHMDAFRAGVLINHKRFGSLGIMYAGVMAVSNFMAKDRNSPAGHTPLAMAKTHRFDNFSSLMSVVDTDQISSC